MITIWHNPRCSKSRQTLTLLQAAGASLTVRRYLDDPPSEDELRAVQTALGRPVLDMVRVKDTAFKDLGLGKTAPDDRLIAALAAHPVLIERPIVIKGDSAVIGRPPEAVRSLL